MIILNKNEPDLEFEGLLKREKIRVKYFQVNIIKIMIKVFITGIVCKSAIVINYQGTMLNPIDLQRVACEKAAAVLVLCDKFSRDPCKN